MEYLEQTEDVDGLAFQHGPTVDLLDDTSSSDAKVWLAGFNLVASIPARDWLLVANADRLDIYKASRFLTLTVNDCNTNFGSSKLDCISYPANIYNLVANYHKAACFCQDEQEGKCYLAILDFESRVLVELRLDKALVDLKFFSSCNVGTTSRVVESQGDDAATPSRIFQENKDGSSLTSLESLTSSFDAVADAPALGVTDGPNYLLMTDVNSCLYKYDEKRLVRFKTSALRISEPFRGRLVLAKVQDCKVYVGVASINKECKLGTTTYHELVLQEPDQVLVATDVLGVCALPKDYIAIVVELQDDGDTLLAIAKASSSGLEVEYVGFNELFIDVDSKASVARVNCTLLYNEAWRCLFYWSNCASNVAIASCNELLTRAPEGQWRSLSMREGFFFECTRPSVFPRGIGVCTSFNETLYRKGACADTPSLCRPPVVMLAQSDGSISISFLDVWVIKDSTQVQILNYEFVQVSDDDDLEPLAQETFDTSQQVAEAPVGKEARVKFDALKTIDTWQKHLLQKFKASQDQTLQELERLALTETLANALVMLEESMAACDAIDGKTAQSLEAHANDKQVFNVPKVPEGALEHQLELMKQLNALQHDLSCVSSCNLGTTFRVVESQGDDAVTPSRRFQENKDGSSLTFLESLTSSFDAVADAPDIDVTDGPASTFAFVSRAQYLSASICDTFDDKAVLSCLGKNCRTWMHDAEANLDSTRQLLESLKDRLELLERRLNTVENRRCIDTLGHLNVSNECAKSDDVTKVGDIPKESQTTIEMLQRLQDASTFGPFCKFESSTWHRPVQYSSNYYNEAAALLAKYDVTKGNLEAKASNSYADANASAKVDNATASIILESMTPVALPQDDAEVINVDTTRDASSSSIQAHTFDFGSNATNANASTSVGGEALSANLGGFQVQQYTFGQTKSLLSGPVTASVGTCATPSVFSSFASKPSSLLDIATGAVGTPTAREFASGGNVGQGIFTSSWNSGASSNQNISSGTFTGVSGFTSGTFAPSTDLGPTSSPPGDFWNRARSSNPLD